MSSLQTLAGDRIEDMRGFGMGLVFKGRGNDIFEKKKENAILLFVCD